MPHPDADIRTAAAIAIGNLIRQQGDIVPWSSISAGFHVGQDKVLFANRARGIFKPAQLNDGAALSVRSSRPSRAKRTARYDDEIIDDGMLHYKFQGKNPGNANNADNQLLQRAYQLQRPLIYFSGLADAVYQIFYPVYVNQIDADGMEALMTWRTSEDRPESRSLVVNDPNYSLRQRTAANQLHLARTRATVLSAYDFQCAFSKLSIGSLLKATTIIYGAEKRGISPVNNAICMSDLHQAAFDAHLIGVSPDGDVELSRLLKEPRHAILRGQLSGSLNRNPTIHLPKSRKLWPDRDCLSERARRYWRSHCWRAAGRCGRWNTGLCR